MRIPNTSPRRPAAIRRPVASRLLASAFAVCATLVSAQAPAVTVSNVPLQSGASYPPPDIYMLVDDSGSMAEDVMPDNPASVSPTDISHDAYSRNGLAYNPNVTYKPWIKADGSRLVGGTSYTAAWSSSTYANCCSPSTTNSSTIDLSGSAEDFYVPISSSADLSQTSSYYRYEIASGGGSISRASFGTVANSATAVSGFPVSGLSAKSSSPNQSGLFVYNYNFVLPAPTAGQSYTSMSVRLSGSTKSGNGADLYVRKSAAPTTSTYDCRSSNSNNTESCTLNSIATGDTWYVSVRDGNSSSGQSFSGVTLTITLNTTNSCPGSSTTAGNTDWINCIAALPNASRTLAQELSNYATWYSYARTRIKMAKSGISEAFSLIGTNVRVGFNTIHNTYTLNIPVGTDNGLFRDLTTPTVTQNRTNWFNNIFRAAASGYTPTRTGLARAGTYYQDASATGPWGPETGAAQISCRQAFTIVSTDGYWNTYSDSSTVLNPIGDDDSSTAAGANPTITNSSGDSYTYSPVNPYRDNPSTPVSKTLADVAMYYWKHDLVPGLENNVPSSAADPAFWQHMVTFGVSIGADGTLNPTTDLPALVNGSKKWPKPTFSSGGGDATDIDDLWHATVNSRGSFVVATNAQAFAQALSSALTLIAARRGSASNVATNSTSFQADTRVFQARYWSGRWTGELAAYSATSAGVATEPSWQASQTIPAPSSRVVLTWNGTGGSTFPTASQLTTLDQSLRAVAPVNGADNAAYIKGNSSQELRNGGTLRDRQIVVRQGGVDVVSPTPLGDIVDSTPIYVNELNTIFVGANDGMMHAFDATTGVEKFAYIPGGIDLSALASLSDSGYTHSYFVDGPTAVSTTHQTPGHNYLVGSLGRGGKGVFGLDVSTPSTFTTADVLWELGGSDNDMGYVLGEPLIVTLNDGTKAVLVSNGINSTNGHAVLFVINLATGAVIKKIDTGVGGDNALFAPRGWDADGNGTVDYVYAGDLKGDLWKFDFTGSTSASWGVALSGSPLFVAKDASNNLQPITAGLALALEPTTGKRWVFIGTGQFLNLTDLANTNVQSMYGIIDNDSTAVNGRTSAGDGDLQQRAIIATGTEANKSVRAFTADTTLDETTKRGWYIDLVTPPSATAEGERIVSNPRVFGTVLVTASLVPPTTGTCDAGGSGFINALNAFTGASLSQPFFNVDANTVNGAQDFSNDVITVAGVNIAVGSVDLGLGMPTLPSVIDELLVAGGSGGTIGSVAINPQGAGSRRISWREIRKD